MTAPFNMRSERMKAHVRIRDLENELAALAARHEKALVEGAARLAERDEARAQIDKLDEAHQLHEQGLWQDITELRASCASLRETKDTFFRNAEAWEAKYNEALAQIAAKDAALADLLSWFPDKPSEPQWQLSAGVYGADAAIAAAREALAAPARETE